MAPVILLLFCSPYATTITSSNCFSTWFKTISSVLPVIATSWSAKPTDEMIRVFASAGTLSEKVPSGSVEAPCGFPFTVTETFATGAPALSITLPLIVRVCAIEINPINRNRNDKVNFFIAF